LYSSRAKNESLFSGKHSVGLYRLTYIVGLAIIALFIAVIVTGSLQSADFAANHVGLIVVSSIMVTLLFLAWNAWYFGWYTEGMARRFNE